MNLVTRYRRPLALNAALLAVLAVVTLAGHVDGQPAGQPTRSRGDYTMVSGRIQGGNSNAIYIVDSTNQEVVAMVWDRNAKRLKGLGYRNMAEDLKTQDSGR